MRRCWTCLNEHDPDEPCVYAVMAAAAPGNAAADIDLFDDAPEGPRLGPVFAAAFESEDACCGEGIEPGEDIRADGCSGWIHADDQCERLAK